MAGGEDEEGTTKNGGTTSSAPFGHLPLKGKAFGSAWT